MYGQTSQSNPTYNTVTEYVCVWIEYLNHIGRVEPEVRCDDFAIHQDFSLLQSNRVFPACNYIQESDRKRKKLILMRRGLYVCETVPVCLHEHGHVSYDVLPLPVAPMIAFIPGLMMPLQQPNTKSGLFFIREHFNIIMID